MTSELYIFLSFIFIGLIISFLFDVFRILRRVYKTPDFITVIQDIMFWIISGFIILFGIFVLNEGKIRAYIFIGIIIGIMLYVAILSRYVMKFGVAFLNLFSKIFIVPVKNAFKMLYSCIFKFTNLAINKFKKLKIDIFNNKKRKKRRIF